MANKVREAQGGTRSLLQSGVRLGHCCSARFAIRRLEFRQFQPPDQRLLTDAGGAGGFLNIPLREQRRNRLLFLTPEF